jgi:hypothetical protein
MKMKMKMIPFFILPDLLGLQGYPGRPPGGADGADELCPEDLCLKLTGDDGDKDFDGDLLPEEMMDTVYSLLSTLPRPPRYFPSIYQFSVQVEPQIIV